MPLPGTIAQRVLLRYLQAKEWPSQPALKQYLQQHPKADKTKHWVKGDPAHKGKPGKPKKSPKKAPSTPSEAESTAAPKRRVIQGRGEIEVERFTGFDRELVDEVAFVPSGDKAPYSALMEGAGKSNEAYYARDWTMGWQGSSEPEAIEEFMSQVHEPGSWANLKYSAVQTLIEAKKEKLIQRGVMDRAGYVTLYRGIGYPQSDDIDNDETECSLGLRGLSSWSESMDTADSFAHKDGEDGKVMKCRIHYSRIVTMWETENDSWRGEKEWTVMADEREDAFMDCEVIKQDRNVYAAQDNGAKPKKKVTLDDSNEDWLRKMRLDKLRKKGWKGTLKEYYEQKREKGKPSKDA